MTQAKRGTIHAEFSRRRLEFVGVGPDDGSSSTQPGSGLSRPWQLDQAASVREV